MLSKDKVLQIIENLPEQFSLDEIVERLITLEKIEIGLQQVAEGKVVSAAEAKKYLLK